MRTYYFGAVAAAAILSMASHGYAVVRHDDAFETSNGNPAGPSNWFAKFGSNASGIAIGPNHILTTRHQGGGVGTSINFPSGSNAGTYTVTSQTLIGDANTDLRVLTINNGSSLAYASLYTGTTVGQTALLGGFGPQRTTPNYVNGSNQLVGYGLTNTPGNGNSLLFGQNRIDSTATGSSPWTSTPLLVADFDGPESFPTGIAPAATNKVDYEAVLAEGDSGGGWFIDVAGTPRLVGLSHGAALNRVNDGVVGPYSGAGTPAFFFGNTIAAVDLTSFTGQINAAIPEPTSLAVLGLGFITALRRRR